MSPTDRSPSRRGVLTAGAFGLTGMVIAKDAVRGSARRRRCRKPRSPQRSDLREPGIAGQPVELSGFVLTRACQPIPGALVDLWHADMRGDYDNTGFRLRGHVFTDDQGGFLFRTIMPGLYPGRTRHYHVKIQAPGASRVLTTQFYFPNERLNRTDGLFRRELLMQMAEAGDALLARFDVVL